MDDHDPQELAGMRRICLRVGWTGLAIALAFIVLAPEFRWNVGVYFLLLPIVVCLLPGYLLSDRRLRQYLELVSGF